MQYVRRLRLAGWGKQDISRGRTLRRWLAAGHVKQTRVELLSGLLETCWRDEGETRGNIKLVQAKHEIEHSKTPGLEATQQPATPIILTPAKAKGHPRGSDQGCKRRELVANDAAGEESRRDDRAS